MDSDDEIFAQALELPVAERAAWLARACGDDAARRGRLTELLAAHAAGPGFMQAPALTRAPLAPAEKPGDKLGPYTLLERIGEGGVGVVWRAQQVAPLRRQVALKVIKRGMDTDAVVARFEIEREALARMDHPSIARVFDAGVTAAGRPYFVMELVRGAPITTFCDEHQFTTAQRLELFLAVCGALQHAHQKGVIHRDLKPSNVLVTENGDAAVPKVIDFGIAKATQGQLGEHTVFTAFEHFIGTPTYMSPEQAGLSSLDLDTRSDIYSLGVLLFELLTGHTPFDKGSFLQGGVDQIRRRIREDEPERPSARIGGLKDETRTTVAQQRATRPAQLALELRGDLDWIVMRCLEKDRTRRYESASALADDLRRFLRHEPVLARPPSAPYVLGKMIRRHRAAFGAAAVVALAVVTGGTVSGWQAVRATRAEREQSRLRAVETALRQQAQEQEQSARRRAYAADMNLAQQAVANENLGLAKRLLQRQVPAGEQPELRGWEWRYLWQLTRSEALGTLATMPQPVSSLSVSRDGHWIALGQAEGGQVAIVNLQTRQVLALPAGAGQVRAVFSPTAPLLAIVLAPGRETPGSARVRLWDLTKRETVAEWPLSAPAAAVAFSADGATLLTAGGGRTGEVARWRVPTGEPLPAGARGSAFANGNVSAGGSVPAGGAMGGGAGMVAVSGDFRLLARGESRSARGRIQVVDLGSGNELWSTEPSREAASALAFSPDGTVLATASGNVQPAIYLWEARTGKPLGRLEGHRSYITSLLFWPDGRTLASAGTDQTIQLWSLETMEPGRTLRGHELEVRSLALLADGVTLVSGAKDGAVLWWDTAAPAAPRRTSIDGVAAWRFAPDGQSVVVARVDGSIEQRSGADFATSQVRLRLPVASSGPQVRVAFAADKPLLAAAQADGRVQVLDWQTQARVAEFATGAANVGMVGFSPAGDGVLLSHETGGPTTLAVQLWDLGTGRVTRTWPLAPGMGPQAAGVDGAALTYRGPETVTAVDLTRGTERQVPAVYAGGIARGVSRDFRLLATASGAGWVRVWELATGKQVAELTGFVLGVHSATFAPDGRRLLTGSGGAEAVRLWDTTSFEPLLTLAADGTVFGTTAFAPDGNTLGARNLQGQLFLWRAPSWAEIAGERGRR